MVSGVVFPKRPRFVKTLLAALLFVAGSAKAQTAGTGTISGAVRDPSGAAITGATVDVRDTDTGIEREVMTDDDGLYYTPFLQPGHYAVNATKVGFAKVQRGDLLLQVGDKLEVDLTLPLKTTEETVTVTGEAPLIEPEKTEVSQTVSETLAGNLPLNGRRWENFVLLTPGVTTDGSHGLVSYHGISGLFNNSSVDGTSNQQAFFSEDRGRTGVAYTYSLDAVQEFQVDSVGYTAEFGQAAGGQVNAITKSGTNDVHGDLFYYLRYPTLNALDPFSKASALTAGQTPSQSEHQRQQFGGSVGGPMIKDKLFYFANYDGQRRSFPIIYTGPSTKNAIAAVNPANCAPTIVIGITTAQCQAAVSYIDGNIGPQPRTGDQDIYFGKLDYQASKNNHLSASFNFMDWKAPNDYSTSPTFSAGSVTQNGSYGTHERFLVGTWDAVISSNVVNDFRFQWSRDFEFYAANFSGPSVSLGSIFGYGMPNALPRPAFPDEHRLEFSDSISMVHGKHTFKFGIDVSPIHELLINLFQGGGIYSYAYTDTNAAATFEAWTADVYNLPLFSDPTTNPATDPRIGKHYNTFQQATDPITGVGKDDFYDVDYAGYAQDTWKLRSNLTLNLGIRYDVQWVPQPQHPNTLTPVAQYYTSIINIDKGDVGPRFGVAWQVRPNTVIRGGYGIFYGKTTNSLYYDTRVENGVYQKTYNCNANFPSSPGTAAACAPVFPNIIFSALGPGLQAPFSGAVTPKVTPAASLPAISLAFRGQDPDFLEPMVNQAEVAVEHQLPWDVTVSGTYLFTRGQHLPVCADANLAPPTSTITYNVLAGSFAPASTVTVPLFTQRLNTGTGIISSCESIVHSLYNAGVFTVKKQFSHQFEVLGNYTIAKTQDDGQVLGDTGTFNGSSDAPLNPYNQQGEWGYSDFDQRQRFVTSALWQPTWKLQNSFLDHLANGFGFSGIVTISSPFPVNGLLSSTVTPPGGIDAGVTGGVEINASSSAGRTPSAPKNSFRGPTQIRDLDFRISRDVRLYKERYRLQILAEAFNLFNHPIVTSVNTSAYSYATTPPAGSGASCSATTPCLVPQPSFLTPTATSNNLVGARQLQLSAKFFF